MELRPGTIFEDRYRVEGVLGEGGMGRVYLARHLELGGRVALKVLRKDRLPRVSGERDAARERLRREARAVSRIRGEHVARVMDAGVSAEHGPYFVMEHVEGESLQALLADGPLPRSAPSAGCSRSRSPSPRPTRSASSIATSSRRTCSSPRDPTGRSS